ncbi:MAG: ShlB/FhaC/HecB family hemolysin secretion/activation protein [Cyanothece sp. SIO2G6]|nr:ShlB/FhaC/HecB family hemolysin secretion/activation protein [Cyanothece sp. SIO2G6]
MEMICRPYKREIAWAVLTVSLKLLTIIELGIGGPAMAHPPWEMGISLSAIPQTNSPSRLAQSPSSLAQSSSPPAEQPQVIPPDLQDALDQTLPERPSPPSEAIPDDLPEPDPSPDLIVPADDAPVTPAPIPDASFFIETVTVLGSTVLTDEINHLIAEYEQRQVTFNELLTLRSRLTQLYIDNGYITSGAFLPSNQVLTDGDVTIQIVEGRVEAILVGETRHLRQSYVRDRLALGTNTPLNQADLQQQLQLLQLDPFITQINAELTTGNAPGQTIVRVEVAESTPWVAALEANNYRPPSIGSNEITATVGRNNILGIGDRVLTSYGITEGLDTVGVEVAVPINPRDGLVRFRFDSSESEIITDEFKDLGIESETRTYSLSLRQPIVRSPREEVGIGIGLDLRRRQTFILDDEPFSFSEEAEEGQTNATIIRLFQDWVRRSPQQVLAVRSQFNIGIDAFDATVNASGSDARFFSWIGQFQWVRQLSERNIIIGRLNAQLTPDSLPSLEQFGLGGAATVRGYSQNELVADNALLASIEARIPVTLDPQRLQLRPFLDVGTVWNSEPPAPDNSTLVGMGLGLRWLIVPDLLFQVDYGIPLIQIEDNSDSLQADSLYFLLRYQPF